MFIKGTTCFTSLFHTFRFKLKQDGIWYDVDFQNSSILEIYFPVDTLVIKPVSNEDTEFVGYKYNNEIVLESTLESTAKLLVLAVDHIDILLEDWYPTLGTRFVHTSEGKFLVTRLIPCPLCLTTSSETDQLPVNFPGDANKGLLDTLGLEDMELVYAHNRIRKSQESYTSECDSGVGYDSTGSSRISSVEGHPNIIVDEQTNQVNQFFYSWMVEECILAAYGSKLVTCPNHGDLQLARIAPDTVSISYYNIEIVN